MTSIESDLPTNDAAHLLNSLENLGIQLWTDDGKLRFRAPKGVLTEDRRAMLKAHRDEIIALLERDEIGEVLAPNLNDRFDPFPLTGVQASYLLGRSDAFDWGGVACHGYVEVEFDDVNLQAMQEAWNLVINRHEMLRAVIDMDGSQRILPEVDMFQVQVNDLREATMSTATSELERTRTELANQVHTPDQWPLFDVRVTQLSDRAIMHLSIDLLICDYTSLQIVLAELDRAYSQPDTLPPVPGLSYRDYVVAHRRLSGGRRYARDKAYWEERVDQMPGAPELPLNPDRPDDEPRFYRKSATLDQSLWHHIRTAAAERDVTPSGAVLAAYAEVIAQWSESPDFTLNLTLLSRLAVHPDVDRVVGDFTSTTLLAVTDDDGGTIAQRARTLTTRLFDDIDHRLFSGVDLIRELRRRRGAGGSLMPVVFTSSIGLSETSAQQGDFTGTGRVGFGISQTPQVWLDCQVADSDRSLTVHWDIRDGVLAPGVIDDMFEAFIDRLHTLAEDTDSWDRANHTALSESQRVRREEVNATSRELPSGLLHEKILHRAQETPDATAILAADGELTYQELVARAHGVCTLLLDRGLKPGEPVGIVADKGKDQPVAVLGVLLAGGAYVPIDSGQPIARIDRILNDSGIRILLAATDASAYDSAVTVSDVEPDYQPVPAPRTADDDLAYIIYTSGSTGTPKGVMISHRAARNTIDDINRRFGVTSDDRVLGVAQLSFDLSVYDLFGVLGAGGILVLPDSQRRGDPHHWAQLISDNQITVWNSVPAQLQMLGHVLSGETGLDVTSLRLALLSGDWIPTTLPDDIRTIIPDLEIISLGGATEASIWSIFHRIDNVDPSARSIPYGKPLSNQSFHILDAQMRDRPDWAIGELYIGGKGLTLGYLSDPTLTAERFITHPLTHERLYKTGDIGRYLPNGDIELLGRLDEQIKIRGHRIEPGEVETALKSFSGVRSAAVVGVGKGPVERRLVGFVEPSRSATHDSSGDETFIRGLRAEVSQAATQVIGELDPRSMVDFSFQVDRVALFVMAYTLRRQGLFNDDNARRTLTDILQTLAVAPRHGRIIRRWLRSLVSEGMLERDAQGYYHHLAYTDSSKLESSWEDVLEARKQLSHGGELIDFLRRTTDRLPEIIRDDFPVQALLFPDGATNTAEAAYKDNLISQYVNAATTSSVTAIASSAHDGQTVRVLEVGAGVGGTSQTLIPALSGLDVEYHYTDVSRFFLDDARHTFAGYPWIQYGLFDINQDFRHQGYEPASIDILLAANVLHNSTNAAEVLERFRDLLAPGGWLVFNEPTRDYYQIMTSMEFMMSPPAGSPQLDYDDLRRGRDRTFIELSEWRQLLSDAGFTEVLSLPGDGEVLGELGQHAVVARTPGGGSRIDSASLARHLSELLPEQMIPQMFKVVDEIPLTRNGKVDRARLVESVPEITDDGNADLKPPQGETETALAELWQDLLGLATVGRDQDFFAIGGDSLVVSRLAARIRSEIPGASELGWETLMRRLLENPTVAGSAAALDRLVTESAEDSDPLIELRAGSDEKPVTVLVHDGSGGLGPYRDLLTSLAESSPDHRILGLSVADTDAYLGVDPANLVAGLAGRYARRLLDAVPGIADGTTRLHVVGYCMGGMIAAEVARILADAGADLAPLTVISSHRVPQHVDDPLVTEYGFAGLMGIDPAELGFPADATAVGELFLRASAGGRIEDGAITALAGDPQVGAAARAFRDVAQTNPEVRLEHLTRLLSSHLGEITKHDLARLREVFRHSLHAVAAYDPDPYPDDIVLLRQTGEQHFMPGLRQSMNDFWTGMCLGTSTVIDISGDHFGCMRGGRAADVASWLIKVRTNSVRHEED